MKTTFDELLRDCNRFENQLANPEPFYQRHGKAYHDTARLIAKRVLLDLIPQGEDKDRWRVKVERVVDRVTGELMVGGGLLLTIFADEEYSSTLAPKGERSSQQSVTHADVVEWIRAGLDGREGGKRITARDRDIIAKQGEKALATIVMRAYYSHQPKASYARLRRVIQRYLFGVSETTGNSLLDAVATAWVEHFTVRHRRDLNAYVGELCRQF